MTPHRTQSQGPPETITSVWRYLGVYIALLFLTLSTTLIAMIDLGPWSMVIALVIASMKALLVILFFMDALHNKVFHPVLFFFGFVWLLILITLTLADYVTRGWIPFPGR